MTRTTGTHFLVERTIDGVAVASIADAELLDTTVIAEVDEELRELADGLGADSLLLNFARVRLMSSGMLGVLLAFSRRFGQLGGRVKLCGLAPDLREVFRLARYEWLFEIYPDELQALDAF